ncbi:MAG: hypothetical protein CMO01_29915 [Thalassobius sp.]|nr:hypothetical protein [Thalassovita sp.]|tara:strand:- start:307 stop:747 length:441 start_codon:yes stop_codon:yes gene_type:complete
MTTRQEHLAFCRICVLRKANPKIGLVCSLTDEHADFEEFCENFEEEEGKKEQHLEQKLKVSGDEEVGDPVNYEKNKSLGKFIFFGGIIFSIMSIGAAKEFGGLFILPFGLVLYGARQYMKGVEQEKNYKEFQKLNNKLNEHQNKKN